MCRDLCQACSKVVGYLLIAMSSVFVLLGLGGAILSALVLWSDTIDIAAFNMPTTLLYGSFAFSLSLLLINLCGCCGFYFAKDKADQKLNGIIEEGDSRRSCCRFGMRLWIFFMFLFGIVHLGGGVYAGVQAGRLSVDIGDYSAQTPDGSALMCLASQGVYERYDPTQGDDQSYNSTDWIDAQNYFGCCGFTFYDTRTFTGGCCGAAFDDEENLATVANSTRLEAHAVVGLCETRNDGWTAEAEPAADAAVATSERLFPSSYTAPDGHEFKCQQMTCSQRFKDLFEDSTIYLIILGCVEIAAAILACFLSCCSSVSKEPQLGMSRSTGVAFAA